MAFLICELCCIKDLSSIQKILGRSLAKICGLIVNALKYLQYHCVDVFVLLLKYLININTLHTMIVGAWRGLVVKSLDLKDQRVQGSFPTAGHV